MRNTDSIISSHNDSNSNPIRLLLVVNVESKMIAFLWGNALTLNIICKTLNAKCIKKVLNWQNISGS